MQNSLILRLVLIFLAIVLTKVTLNLANAFYLSYRYAQFKILHEGNSSVLTSLLRGKGRTIALFKQANISDKKIITAKPIGFGQVVTVEPHMFDQYPALAAGLASATIFSFESAIGTYKSRAIDAINPLYWVALVVYLPTKMLAALGVKADSIPVKILQGLYWFLSAGMLAFWALYKAQLLTWLKTLIDKLLA